MKTILSIAMLAAGAANAAGAVYITSPDNVQPDGYIVLDAPGTVRWNSQVDTTYIASGICQIDRKTNFNGTSSVIGATCSTAGSIHFVEKLPVWTCPGDGAVLQASHITVSLDGVVFYDEPQRTGGGICYVTPAPLAVKSWAAPVLTFTNPSADRATDTANFVLYDAAYLYSQHTFTVTGSNAGCSTLLKNIGTRFAKRMVEAGFQCYAKLAPGETATVVVQ